jgi:hypothetical protein
METVVASVDSQVRFWLLRAWETYVLPGVVAAVGIGARKGIGFLLVLFVGMGIVSIATRAFFWALNTLVGLGKFFWTAVLWVWTTLVVLVKFYWRTLVRFVFWALYLGASGWVAYMYLYESLADAATQDMYLPFIGRWLNTSSDT